VVPFARWANGGEEVAAVEVNGAEGGDRGPAGFDELCDVEAGSRHLHRAAHVALRSLERDTGFESVQIADTAAKRDGTSDASDDRDRPSTRDDVPLRGGDRERDRAIADLTRAIDGAIAAERWTLAERLTTQLERLTPATPESAAAGRVAAVRTIRSA
jgi:hypothetical protein